MADSKSKPDRIHHFLFLWHVGCGYNRYPTCLKEGLIIGRSVACIVQSIIKVDRIEVKRCFVASEKVKNLLEKNEVDLQTILGEVKNEVLKMSEPELEREITWLPRLETYNKLVWYLEKCSIDDLGVWYGAAGLPETWCVGSLRETVHYIRDGEKEITRISKYGRDKRAIEKIPKIVKVADKIVTNRLQIPIVVLGGTFRRPHPCHRMKWDIDDGNLRAIAFAIKGYETFDAYVGKTS